MVMPMPEFVTCAEPFPVRLRSIAHIDDRAVLEADDLSFATDEASVQDLRANAIGDGEEVDFLGLRNAKAVAKPWLADIVRFQRRVRQVTFTFASR